MRLRTVFIALSASGLLAGSTAAIPAEAAPPGCSIRDFSPKEVVIGPEGSRPVQFALDTTCPVDDDVNWYLTGRSSTAPPGPYGSLLLANFYQPSSSRYRYVPDGATAFGRPSTAADEALRVSFSAFLGDPSRAADWMSTTGIFRIKHQTQFRLDPGTEWTVAPAAVSKNGTVTLSSRLLRATWTDDQFAAQYSAYASPVVVEFRGDGNSRYQAVQTVQAAADGAVTATVTVKKAGTYRLRFAGDDTSGRSKTTEKFVAVTK
jgi:hypothetical protein